MTGRNLFLSYFPWLFKKKKEKSLNLKKLVLGRTHLHNSFYSIKSTASISITLCLPKSILWIFLVCFLKWVTYTPFPGGSCFQNIAQFIELMHPHCNRQQDQPLQRITGTLHSNLLTSEGSNFSRCVPSCGNKSHKSHRLRARWVLCHHLCQSRHFTWANET